jgi:hypothetical protein
VTGGCWLYKDSNFAGSAMWIPSGWDYNDLHRINGFGDVVSSIQCDPDVGATVWVNSNFGGTSTYVAGDAASLGTMNDKISSISWADFVSTGYCTFFTDSNYGGSTLTVPAGLDYNDLHRASPSFGDNISSVSCAVGTSPMPWVCTNDSWALGTCFHLGGNYPNLGSVGYGDNISSIRWF